MSNDSMHDSTTKANAEEIWVPIPGLESWYSASSLGRIRSEPRQRTGLSGRPRIGRILVSRPSNCGYMQVRINQPGKETLSTVHALVASAFLGVRPDGMTVNHKNGIKSDNRPDNLEYVTLSENQKHAFRTGLKRCVFANRSLSDDQIRQIRLRRGIDSQAAIAREYGVSQSTVSLIWAGKIWNSVA